MKKCPNYAEEILKDTKKCMTKMKFIPLLLAFLVFSGCATADFMRSVTATFHLIRSCVSCTTLRPVIHHLFIIMNR